MVLRLAKRSMPEQKYQRCATRLSRLGLLLAGLSTAFFHTVPAQAVDRGDHYAGKPWASRSPIVAKNGMVTSHQPLASQAGLRILQKGGNAVDAAIATSAMLALVQPNTNGLGGDAFFQVWDPKSKQLYGYNGSGPAPGGTSFDDMKRKVEKAWKDAGEAPEDEIPYFGPLGITVPGLVDSWFAIHKRFGKLPMKDILEPAIEYAQRGFPMTQVVAKYMEEYFDLYEDKKGFIKDLDNAKAIYMPDGHTPREGEIFRNPMLANTLQRIADNGRDEFYKGRTARRMVDFLQDIGTDFKMSDFADYSGEWVKPIATDYHGYTVHELPPNDAGSSVIQILNLLKGFDLKKWGPDNIKSLMAQIEAKRLAFADMAAYYGDPRYYREVSFDDLISQTYADKRRQKIDLDEANTDIDPGNPKLMESDTTNFSTADRDGMMVSYIQSNYYGTGSGEAAPKTGFIFQNRGQLFSLHKGDANQFEPGKRPFHTIMPAFVTKDDKPWMAFQVMGGDFQPMGQTQVLVNLIDFGMNIQEAGDAARWYHEGSPLPHEKPGEDSAGTVKVESGLSEMAHELEEHGYDTEIITPNPDNRGLFGGYQAIIFDPDTGTYHGAADMRKDGQTVGY